MTRRERLLLALFFLSVLSAVTVSGRLLLGQATPAECNDGVDNDGDGRTDALINLASDPNATRTWGALGREVMLYMYYELAILPYNSSNTFDDDAATTKKICELAGFKNVQSATKRYFGSCGDNGIYYWNGSAWALGAACGRDGFVSTLVCQGKFAKCENGIDDDGDGLIDTADGGCASASDNSEIEHDPHCTSTSVAYELPRQCQNGIDDDGDGDVDYPADPDCKSALDHQEQSECSDNIDNDGDGVKDYPADFSCANEQDDDETNPKAQCQDGSDNDSDGVQDHPADFSCASKQDNDETDPKAQCQDGLDNDADSATDHPADFSCSSTQDDDETNPKPLCNNGVDDDGDGRTDLLDPACKTKQDNEEKSVCNDGLDNDNDGATDGLSEVAASGGSSSLPALFEILPERTTVPILANGAAIGNKNPGDNDYHANGVFKIVHFVQNNFCSAGSSCFYQSGKAVGNDAASAQKICEYAGYSVVASTQGVPFTSCNNNTIALWRDGTWATIPACTSNSQLWSVTCSSPIPQAPTSACNDGVDNDGDGKTDYPADNGCASTRDKSELLHDFACASLDGDSEGAGSAQCQDNIDNDGDGAKDYPADGSCSSNQDNDEKNPIPQCQDGIDNDKDGAMDSPDDFSCVNKQDGDESLAKSQCQDGTDNDGDGVFDLADPGCASSQDNREDDEVCQEPLVLIYNLQPLPFTTSALPKEVTELRALTYNITHHNRLTMPTLQEAFMNQFDIVWLLNGCGQPQQQLSNGELVSLQQFQEKGGHLVLSVGNLSTKNATNAHECMSRVNQVTDLFGATFEGLQWDTASCKDTESSTALLNGVDQLYRAPSASIKLQTASSMVLYQDAANKSILGHLPKVGTAGNVLLLPQEWILQKSCSNNQAYRNLFGMLGYRLGCSSHVTQCNDQIDNDNDDDKDLKDSGCQNATDESEQDDVWPLQGGACLLINAESSGTGTLAVECPSRYVAVGGGWSDYGVSDAGIDMSRPLVQGQGWECERNTPGSPAVCQAICCSDSIIETKIISTTGRLDSHIKSECPAGFTVTGGGFVDQIKDKDDEILRPEGEQSWYCFDDNSTSTNSQCYAICARLTSKEPLSCTTITTSAQQALIKTDCPANTVITGGGFVDNSTGNDDTDTNNAYVNSGWQCVDDFSDSPGTQNTCYARCCTIPALTGSGSSSSGYCGDGIRQSNEVCLAIELCDVGPGTVCCPQDCGIISSSPASTSSSQPATSTSSSSQPSTPGSSSSPPSTASSSSSRAATTSTAQTAGSLASQVSSAITQSSAQTSNAVSSSLANVSSQSSSLFSFLVDGLCPSDACAIGGSELCAIQGQTCQSINTAPCFTCMNIPFPLGGCLSDAQCQPWELCSNGACVYRATLEVLHGASTCGNGMREELEECDDGNLRDGDNCSADCLFERGTCGDGIVQRARNEQCEPGLPLLGSVTCSEDCKLISKSCGNGLREQGEECDAGTRNSNVPGALCRSNCSLSRCGDGIVDAPAEACDDGNRVALDGCSRTCEIETENPAAPDAPGTTLAQIVAIPLQSVATSSAPVTQTVILGSASQHAPVAATGPGALGIMAAGAASGIAYIRRRHAKKGK